MHLSNINISTVDVLLSAGWQARLSQWGADRNVRPCQPTWSAQICNLALTLFSPRNISLTNTQSPVLFVSFTKSNWLRLASSNCAAVLQTAGFKGYLSHRRGEWRISASHQSGRQMTRKSSERDGNINNTQSPHFGLFSASGGVTDFLQNKL